jgi:hypothetical protein
MAHKLNAQNQDWKDQVDAGLTPPVDEHDIDHVVDFQSFWERIDKTRSVRCHSVPRSGRQPESDLTKSGKLSKDGKRYVCTVTTDVCVPSEAGAVRNGTRQDPPVTINLTKFGPETVARHSMTSFLPTR